MSNNNNNNTNNEFTSFETPNHLRGQQVTNAILSALNSDSHPNDDDDEPNAKQPKYIRLTPDQLSSIVTACSSNIMRSFTPTGVSSPHAFHPSNTVPAYYNNAKYEEICCRAIKSLYDGSEEELMPFLTRIDMRRQDEGWAPATYVTVGDKTYDLTFEFAHVTEDNIIDLVHDRWTSPTKDVDKHTIGHPTCQARLLAKCLMQSLTTTLVLTITIRVPHKYHNDSTYILWALSNNIHRNNIAFMEHIREKIATATIAHHQNDIEKYLIYIKNNLRMITMKSTKSTQNN
jgi:hypothetical protein